MKQHSFDGISFFSGLVITLIGLVFLIPNQPTDLIDFFSGLGGWFWPILLVAIGIAVLVPVLVPKKNQEIEGAGVEAD